MAKNNNLGDFLTDIANAIRTKKGTSGIIQAQDFSSEIDLLPSIVELTQSQYDALSVYDDNTYYLIVEV